MINIKVIGSSSKGNCYVLETSKEKLLLECGMDYKKILYSLDFDFSKVVGCLLTHEHGDHSKSIEKVARAGINIYSSKGTFSALSLPGHRCQIIKSEIQFKIGGFTILPFETQHDCNEPLGFLIHHDEFGKLLFATDTFYIKNTFTDLNYIMVECNYSKEILERNIQEGNLPIALKNRLLSSHFSLENVKKFLKANDLSKVQRIMLMHLSNGNSDERLFKNEIEQLTGIPTIIF